jgi:hypothetical protein
MVLTIDEEKRACRWCITIQLDELADLFENFLRQNPATQNIERQAERLVNGNFQSYRDLCDFIKAVCKWGGYSGIAGRVINENDESKLRYAFRSASSHSNAGDDLAAIKSLLELRGFAVSFASKHLKFVAPERAVVLDSRISNRLGYELTPEGYQTFLLDCRGIRDRANSFELRYPGWGRDGWRVSDIEMAIFEKLRV